MDRMNPLDAEFLFLEDGTAHMHIASRAEAEAGRALTQLAGGGATGPYGAGHPPGRTAGVEGAAVEHEHTAA